MASQKISQLPAATTTSNGDLYPIVQGGYNFSITFTKLQTAILTGLTLPFSSITGQATLAQLPSIANNTVLGNVAGSTTTPTALSTVQLTTLVNLFTSSLSGAVPASGGGTANFLRADGTWSTPPVSSGTVTSVSVVSANGFAGSVANPTTTPAITLSTTVTGILFGNGTSVAAAVAGNFPTLNQNTTGTASNITASSNSTLTTLSALSLPATQLSGTLAAAQFPALTGDVTTTAGSLATTLATVNANVGTFGSTTAIPVITVNGKGLVTAISTTTVSAAAGSLSGTTLNATVVNSSLTGVGTITNGTWNGAVTAGNSFLTTTGAGTYTTPANISTNTTFKFTLIGGGGGGGGSNTGGQTSSGGGAGGGLILEITGLSPSTGYTISIGTAGAGGANTPTAGGTGGNTTLVIGATTYTASGGVGGGTTATTPGAAGTGTNGTINITAQAGGADGSGGSAPFGFGLGAKAVALTPSAGNPGTGYGAGGGGGRGAGVTQGGNATQGMILVEWNN